jgi:hypothetical protein
MTSPTASPMQASSKVLDPAQSIDAQEAPTTNTPDNDASVSQAPANDSPSSEGDPLDDIISELNGGSSNPEGFEAFAQQFKEYVGVDLKEAVSNYERMVQAQEAQQHQVLLSNISSQWGVQGEELDRRIEKVLQVVDKLKPEERAKYDSIEGIMTLWDRINRGSAKAPASRGENSASPTSSTGGKTFKASEIEQMMFNDPAAYNAIQGDLAKALAEGRYIDDTNTRKRK